MRTRHALAAKAIFAFASLSLASVVTRAVAQSVQPVATTIGSMPHDLSPMGMFLAADPIVKGIIAGLLLASVATWTVWLAKNIELRLAKRKLTRALGILKQQRQLAEASSRLANAPGLMSRLLSEAMVEIQLSSDIRSHAGTTERVASRLSDVEGAAARSMRVGMGLLATIGSTGPFVGLFGTVWGIMNSFIGIAQSNTTNLAVVAPGIAEALLATAIGLFAAIPAVVFYNSLARSVTAYRALVRQSCAEVLRLVSRDFDRMAERGPLRKLAAE